MDEANRKVRFHQIVNHQEASIRDHVLSLEIINKNSRYNHLNSGQYPRILSNSSTTTPIPALDLSQLQTTRAVLTGLVLREDLEKRSAPKFSHRKSGHSNQASTKVIEKSSVVGVDCCDVRISYWFREDFFQNLFFQTLMLILCVSRWLITRTELNLNQRSLILVISVATAADTLDFFGYLGMQMVYTSWHLLYSVLLIVSLSLIQFVFLHVDDDCLSSGHAFTSGNHTVPTKTGNSLENDAESGRDVMMMNDDETCKNDKMGGGGCPIKKKQTKFALFNRQYEFLKRHLKAEESLRRFNGNNDGPNLNRFGHHLAFQIQSSKTRKSALSQCLCSSFCCCLQHRDPLLFILLASIFLHDGSYLTFRLFALTKLGFEVVLLDRPLLLFFLAKNVLIISTQIYKVYAASGERRERRIMESYRELMMAAQQQQQHDGMMNTSHGPGGFLPLSQSAAIAAAATGGQIPLIGGLSCFQGNPPQG